MSHIVFYKVALTCRNCGTVNDAKTIRLHTSSFGQDPDHTLAWPGDVLPLELEDFEDGFASIRAPQDDSTTLRVIETWGCLVCKATNVARLTFERVDDEHYRFEEASVVPITREGMASVSFISHKLEQYAPYPGDDEALLAALVEQSR